MKNENKNNYIKCSKLFIWYIITNIIFQILSMILGLINLIYVIPVMYISFNWLFEIIILFLINMYVKNIKRREIFEKIWHISSIIITVLLLLGCIIINLIQNRYDNSYYGYQGKIYYKSDKEWYYYNDNKEQWLEYIGETNNFEYLGKEYKDEYQVMEFEN